MVAICLSTLASLSSVLNFMNAINVQIHENSSKWEVGTAVSFEYFSNSGKPQLLCLQKWYAQRYRHCSTGKTEESSVNGNFLVLNW